MLLSRDVGAVASPHAAWLAWLPARRRQALAYGLLVAVVGVVYSNALPAAFVMDDHPLLAHVEQLGRAADLLPYLTIPERIDPHMAPLETRVYRPIVYVYAAAAYRLWGRRAWAWHAANVVLHAMTACLAMLTLRRLFGLPPGAALLASLLWAVHPVHVQAVTYASSVSYLLMGLFLLVAVLLTCGWWPPACPWPFRALAAVAAFGVSVLSHELGLMAPALAALGLVAAPGVGWAWGNRIERGALATLAATGVAAVGYVVVRITLIGGGQAGRLGEALGTIGPRLLQAPEILLRYLALLAVPARLTLDRSQDVPLPSGVFDPRAWLTWAACGLLLWGVARIARRVPVAAVGSAWFLVAYFPTSNTLIPLYSVMAEHYIYIASLGIVAGAVAAARAAAPAGALPRAATLAAALLVVAYGARTTDHSLSWRNEITFYQTMLAGSPRSAFLHNNLGAAYYRGGSLELAEGEFHAALGIDPAHTHALFNLGSLALGRGRLDDAEAFYLRAIAIDPEYFTAYYHLGYVADRRGQTPEAIRWLERAVALWPAHAGAQLHLGEAYLTLDPARAAQHLRRFLSLAPNHPQAPAVRARLARLPAASRP